jgi:hypothetical protein
MFGQVIPPASQSITVIDSGTACVTAPAACATWDITTAPSVTMEITGTFTGTLTFEATAGGATWFSVAPINLSTGVAATTTTTTGQFSLTNSGLLRFRARATAAITGGANITLTRGTALSAKVFTTGTLAATNGGTGVASYAVGDLLSANTTTSLSRVAAVAAGQVLASAGLSTLPAYTANPVVLTVATGATTATSAGASIHGTKVVTAIPNNMATTVLTWSVGNVEATSLVKIHVIGSLGAGGAVGAGECATSIEFLLTVTRVANVNAVSAAASAAEATGNATVAGGATCTIARSLVGVSGGAGATNTQAIQVNITAGSGSSTNHVATIEYWILNKAANGVTIS